MVRSQRGGVRESTTDAAGKTQPLGERAKQLIDDVLRPMATIDGGEIELVSIDEARMIIRLRGAYAGCPSRPYTVRMIQRAAQKVLQPNLLVETTDE